MTRRDNNESLISARLEVIQCDRRGGLFTAGRQDQGQRSPPRLWGNRTSTTGAPLPLLKQVGSGSATVRVRPREGTMSSAFAAWSEHIQPHPHLVNPPGASASAGLFGGGTAASQLGRATPRLVLGRRLDVSNGDQSCRLGARTGATNHSAADDGQLATSLRDGVNSRNCNHEGVCWTEIREANRVEDDVLEADSARRRLTRRAGELQCRAGHWSCRASPGWFGKAGGLRSLSPLVEGAFGANLWDLAARCDGEEHRAIGRRGMVTCEGKAWGRDAWRRTAGGEATVVELVVSPTTTTPHCLCWGEEGQTLGDGQATPPGRHNHHHISVDCIRLSHETREKGKDGRNRDMDRGCSEPGTLQVHKSSPYRNGIGRWPEVVRLPPKLDLWGLGCKVPARLPTAQCQCPVLTAHFPRIHSSRRHTAIEWGRTLSASLIFK
ncbi:hypothetical protein B0T18DRAFT_92058 [Schizothecium vesticola]|uniref:Uncharacterized protein n=1 Tax=Schizothecium vesticola TaxID=314040 RepID=A0AA40KB68_9PEZI|nr:hypothetical protein B0T18DRAFT_92058 [Schizothecium vesticola]